MNASASPATFPTFEKLIAATMDALRYLGGSASNREIHDEVVRILRLPDAAVEFPHKSGTKTYLAIGFIGHEVTSRKSLLLIIRNAAFGD
jgi:hypothetical protein